MAEHCTRGECFHRVDGVFASENWAIGLKRHHDAINWDSIIAFKVICKRKYAFVRLCNRIIGVGSFVTA